MKAAIALEELSDSAGFWGLEFDSEGPFRWSRPVFRLATPAGNHPFLGLSLASAVPGNALRVRAGGTNCDIPLLEGWQRLDLPIQGAAAIEIAVRVPYRPERDERELGVMLRHLTSHDDPHLHDLIQGRHANALLNEQEFRSGAETIRSAPPFLRITLSKSCNIADQLACVYCAWDWAKDLEKDSPDMTPEFLARMGRFFRDAAVINDCSYGEPPLEQQFAQALDMITLGDRIFEFTSNGQTLSTKIRSHLIGKPVRIYVSLDAATAASFERCRDSRFELIIRNLRDLCREKDGNKRGSRPEVIVSFIVMRSNLDEIEKFVQLMKSVAIDRICFRTLYRNQRGQPPVVAHNGHSFTYARECLEDAELRVLSDRCRRAGEQEGIPVTIEWDDFVTNVSRPSEASPLCSEPWKTAYVLARGLMPCCYGRDPLVTWDEIDAENVEGGIEAALNSAPFRELRRELAAGRPGAYCKRTPACPIVNRLGTAHAGTVSEDADCGA